MHHSTSASTAKSTSSTTAKSSSSTAAKSTSSTTATPAPSAQPAPATDADDVSDVPDVRHDEQHRAGALCGVRVNVLQRDVSVPGVRRISVDDLGIGVDERRLGR